MKKTKKSYLVREDILPEAILKTVMAKEMLSRGEALTINEAVDKVGVSRSAFYKYKDGISAYAGEDKERIAAFALVLEHQPNVLPNVLNYIASIKGSIVSLNQNTPVRGMVAVSLYINIALIKEAAAGMMAESLMALEGVRKAEHLAQI